MSLVYCPFRQLDSLTKERWHWRRGGPYSFSTTTTRDARRHGRPTLRTQRFPSFFTRLPRYQIKCYSTYTTTTTHSTAYTFHSSFVLTRPTTPFLHPYASCYPIFCGFRRNCTIHDSSSRPDLRRFRPLPCFFTSYIRSKTSPATIKSAYPVSNW